jgi:hypothetical protein
MVSRGLAENMGNSLTQIEALDHRRAVLSSASAPAGSGTSGYGLVVVVMASSPVGLPAN